MEPGSNLVSEMLKSGSSLLGNEEVVAEALRDLLKDEVKAKMRETLDADPALKEELKAAVRLYYEAKLYEAYATLKFVKASAKLGVQMMPSQMREDLGKEIGSFLEKEVAALLSKAI